MKAYAESGYQSKIESERAGGTTGRLGSVSDHDAIRAVGMS
jgi:hypothetical protein